MATVPTPDTPAVSAYVRSKVDGNWYRVGGPRGASGPPGPPGQTAVVIFAFMYRDPGELPPSGFIPKDWDRIGNPIESIQFQAGQAALYQVDDTIWIWSDVPTGHWFSAGLIVGPSGPSGPTGPRGPAGPLGPLNILTDVIIDRPADDQALVFNSGTQLWSNVTVLTAPEVYATKEAPPTSIKGPIVWGDVDDQWVPGSDQGTVPQGGLPGEFLMKTGTADFTTDWKPVVAGGEVFVQPDEPPAPGPGMSLLWADSDSSMLIGMGEVPGGGQAEEVLTKDSGVPYDYSWRPAKGAVPQVYVDVDDPGLVGVDMIWANLSQAGTVVTAPYVPVTGGSMSGNLTFTADDLGVNLFGGARIYKKTGSGLTFRTHSSNTQPVIENNDGSNRRDVIDRVNGDARYRTIIDADTLYAPTTHYHLGNQRRGIWRFQPVNSSCMVDQTTANAIMYNDAIVCWNVVIYPSASETTWTTIQNGGVMPAEICPPEDIQLSITGPEDSNNANGVSVRAVLRTTGQVQIYKGGSGHDWSSTCALPLTFVYPRP